MFCIAVRAKWTNILDEAEFRIGIISDTHGLLRPQALERLRGSHHIIHAGDIGAPSIINALQALAPTTAIRGNIDKAKWAANYPIKQTLHLAGLSFHILHKIEDLSSESSARVVDAVIFGHSHRASITTREGTLFINPGSAGPRRFSLPVTVASLRVAQGSIRPQIHDLLP